MQNKYSWMRSQTFCKVGSRTGKTKVGLQSNNILMIVIYCTVHSIYESNNLITDKCFREYFGF